MYPQITINISISPDGVRILEDTTEAEGEEFAVPATPEVGSETSMDETDFAPPVPEEEFEEVAEAFPIPPEPEE